MNHPIYIPSRGRTHRQLTVVFLNADGIIPSLVVEPQEFDIYMETWGNHAKILPMDEDNQGIAYARNWIKDHAKAEGHEWHWQLDDNIRSIRAFNGGMRVPVVTGNALGHVENLTKRYTNVAITGLFAFAFGHRIAGPFLVNKMVYSCMFIRSDDYRWDEELDGIEDVDYSLQVLANGECTILVQAYQAVKAVSGQIAGGNTDLYDDDGRLERTRALQRKWGTKVVRMDRSWNRTRHNLKHVWRRFDTPLIKREA